MKLLKKEGLDSAFKISTVPRTYFLKQFGGVLGGVEKAKEIRVNAMADDKQPLYDERDVWIIANNIFNEL